MSARRAREEAGHTRVKGYLEYELKEIELEDENGFKLLDVTDQQNSSLWWGKGQASTGLVEGSPLGSVSNLSSSTLKMVC